MKEKNNICTNKIFDPDFYLLWNGISKRVCKRHKTIESADIESKRLINTGCKNIFIIRPCFMYSCIKTGSKRIVYSKPLNETEYNNENKMWYVWSKDRKTIKKYFSIDIAKNMAKKCSIMYNQKYIVFRCIKNIIK